MACWVGGLVTPENWLMVTEVCCCGFTCVVAVAVGEFEEGGLMVDEHIDGWLYRDEWMEGMKEMIGWRGWRDGGGGWMEGMIG